jgi:hypothetical protein
MWSSEGRAEEVSVSAGGLGLGIGTLGCVASVFGKHTQPWPMATTSRQTLTCPGSTLKTTRHGMLVGLSAVAGMYGGRQHERPQYHLVFMELQG